MRTRLLSAAATALSATAFAAEPPPYLPGGPARPAADAPALVPIAPPAPKSDCDCNCNLSGGSTGLRPGIDCLPPPSAVRKSRPRLYGELEYVLTWFDDRSPPPLVGTSPPVFPAIFPGPVATNVLYGGDRTDFGGIDGLRATAGYWLDDQQNLGIEASGFLTERASTGFAAGHNGAADNPVVLGRIVPSFAGPVLGPLVGIPGITQGGIAVAERTRLWGAEIDAVAKGIENCNGRFDALVGFRYLDLDESLATASVTETILLPGTPISSADNFAARTQFYGGQFGARVRADWGRATASATAKLGFGASHQAVNRTGTMTTGNFVAPGDFLVPFVGRDTTDKFAVVPEGLLKVGFRVTDRLEVNAGYSILYLSSVARAADQVNDGFAAKRGIDSTDFVAQGISFGLGYRY